MQQNGAKTANNVGQTRRPDGRFVKGDPRCNRNGRPRTFDQARALAQAIAHEELTLPDGRKITVAEAVLRQWAKSKEPQLQKAFIEYCFGKVPDKLEAIHEHKTRLFLNYAHEDRHPRADRSSLPAPVSSGAN